MTSRYSHVRRTVLLLSFLLSALLCVPPSAFAQAADFAHFDVATDGDTIHLLTGQGKKGTPEIPLYHRVSKNGGATWRRPVRVTRDSNRLLATHPRVAVTSKGTVTLWFEGQPWGSAKLLANGRPIESAVR